MAFNIQDDVLLDELDAWLASHAGESWNCHLYQNNYVPAAGETIANYTEATFNGYAAQSFDPDDMRPPVVTAHVAIATLSAALTFTHGSTGASQIVYGYYVTDGSGNLAWGENFATARTLAVNDQEKVTPVYKTKNCP